ncbi:unnamed protein product [Alopecurus aequalis]
MNNGGSLGSMEIDEELRVCPPLSAAELESFAARMEVTPDLLRHIVAPMEGVGGIDLRKELEEWTKEHVEEKKRTEGMDLQQLNADTDARFIPEVAAVLRHAQDLLAALDQEEEEEEAAKARPRAAL